MLCLLLQKDIEAPLPVVLSEYNLWTNTLWDTRGTSADTPLEVRRSQRAVPISLVTSPNVEPLFRVTASSWHGKQQLCTARP